jgi:hypothetical protein
MKQEGDIKKRRGSEQKYRTGRAVTVSSCSRDGRVQNLGEIVLPAINKEVRRSWMIASTLAKTHDTLNETYNGERQDDRDGTRTIGRRC